MSRRGYLLLGVAAALACGQPHAVDPAPAGGGPVSVGPAETGEPAHADGPESPGPAAGGEAAALLERVRELHRAQRRREALDLLSELEGVGGDPELAADALLLRGDLLRDSGRGEEALVALDEALEAVAGLAADERRRWWRARILRQRAQARIAAAGPDGYRVALADLDRAAELLEALGDSRQLAGLAAARASLASQVGDWETAVAAGRVGLQELGRHRDPEEAPGGEELGALAAVAWGSHRLGRDSEALAAYDTLIEGAGRRNDQRYLLFAYCNRSELLQRSGRLTESEADLRRAVDRIEFGRDRLAAPPDGRVEYSEERVVAYDRLIRRLVDTGRGVEAFELAERFRARSFLELLARAGSPADRASHGTTLGADELAARLGDGEVVVSYWSLDERLLAWTITREGAQLVQVPLDRAELLATLRDYVEPLELPSLALGAALARTEAAHLAAGLRLSRWLVEPLPGAAERAQRWIVVADAELHRLPFAALPLQCSGDVVPVDDDGALFSLYAGCRFLGLERALVHLPSASSLAALEERELRREAGRAEGGAPSAEGALILAPTFDDAPAPRAGGGGDTTVRRASSSPAQGALPALPAAQAEARRLRDIVPGSRLVAGREATEAALAAAGRARYLHFATHGRIDPERPDEAEVVLAPSDGGGPGADGVLRLPEVLELELGARLVSLAACRTGVGPLRRSEGILGLARAFQIAGADRVLVARWDVDDELGARLVPELYRSLVSGLEAGEALRRARLAIFETEVRRPVVFRYRRVRAAHPGLWASFALYGRS